LRYLKKSLGRRCGGSTDKKIVATLHLAREMHEAGQCGSIVTVLCDSGERYSQTYYSDEWLAAQGFDAACMESSVQACAVDGNAMPWELAECRR